MNERKSNIWLCILSVLVPIAGWLLYFAKKDTEKDAAKTYGICGIIGFVINLLFFI